MHHVSATEIGWLTEAEMIEIDRIMIEDLRIELIQMMENAGRNLARLVIDEFDPATVVVLVGSGGNGGGGLVAARHLANMGCDVRVTPASSRFTPVPAHQLDIIERMGIPVVDEPARADVVIDALIGYSLRGAPRGRIGELVAQIDQLGDQVVSLDTPSGLNVTDGSTPGTVVSAHATMTLGLPKVGLRGSARVGDLFVADISIPPSAYTSIGAGPAPDFSTSSILRIVD